MINVITKIICSILLGFTISYLVIKVGRINCSKYRFLISVFLISLITYTSIIVKYNSEINLIKIILISIIIKIAFRESTYKTILLTLISMILIFIGDIIASILINGFITLKDAKTKWYCILPCNLLVFIISLIVIKISIVNKNLNKILDKIEQKKKISIIVMFILSVIIIINLFYNINYNFSWNEKYIINILLVISYIVILCIFLKDKLEYDVLEEKYDALFEYFSEIAENIDDLNLTTHEYKNQIAIVGNYIDNKKYKKAKEYIDDISKSINKDEGLLVNLTDIPTGGLKGLLYYKIIVAKNQKVEIVLDVGKNTKKLFKKLSEQEIKIITRIIGVYIDNAVAACKNKIVNIEIYKLDDNLVFTISNTVNNNFDIKKIGKKGFTTKGKGHGQGLYLTNRLIGRNKWLKSENKLVNNYYVTKLVIDTKNIGK